MQRFPLRVVRHAWEDVHTPRSVMLTLHWQRVSQGECHKRSVQSNTFSIIRRDNCHDYFIVELYVGLKLKLLHARLEQQASPSLQSIMTLGHQQRGIRLNHKKAIVPFLFTTFSKRRRSSQCHSQHSARPHTTTSTAKHSSQDLWSRGNTRGIAKGCKPCLSTHRTNYTAIGTFCSHFIWVLH